VQKEDGAWVRGEERWRFLREKLPHTMADVENVNKVAKLVGEAIERPTVGLAESACEPLQKRRVCVGKALRTGRGEE
jgi:hypothetical protein